MPAVNRADLLEGYVSFDHSGWEVSAGKQNLSWGVGEGGSMILSDNAEPLTMVRLTRVTSTELPGFLSKIGHFRTDWFVGKVKAEYIYARPGAIWTELRFHYYEVLLEIDVARTGMLGRGRSAIGGDAFTTSNFIKNFFGIKEDTNNLGAWHRWRGPRGSIDFNFDIPGLKQMPVIPLF